MREHLYNKQMSRELETGIATKIKENLIGVPCGVTHTSSHFSLALGYHRVSTRMGDQLECEAEVKTDSNAMDT